MNKNHITEVSGYYKTYNAETLSTPLPEFFEYENYVCVFSSVINNAKHLNARIYFQVAFYKSFNQNDLIEFDYKGFLLNEVYLIKTKEEESYAIIEDIKSNPYFYRNNFNECI